MKLERVVVEFTHPGVEYIPKKRVFDEHVIWKDEKKTSGIRKWNELPSHKRKFLLCKGTYVDKDWKAKQAPLTFWGEWEAQSYFKSTGLKKGISPQFLHKPFLDDSYSGLRKNNTDPFVFGNNFWYTNCKQRKGSFTTRLDDFSIILFGTERKNGFYLDTVFVVGKSISPPFSDRFLETC